MARFRTVVLALAGVMVAACSGSGSAEPSSSSASTAAPTTQATTTTSTTVGSTTTTTSPAQALEAEKAKVEAGYRAAVKAYDDATFTPEAVDEQAMAQNSTGQFLSDEHAKLADFREQHRRVRPNEPDLRQLIVESIELDSASATHAAVVSCNINNLVVFEPGTSPGPDDDIIVNDELGAIRSRFGLVKEVGTWKVETNTILGTWPGTSACPSS